mmetsp:Transcript_4184/g.12365  ORF Transcript_4184/g.12365 Transcript_4184/m.12365 type:complete len:295 (-) Transcript_4184:119-1003(-)
MSAQSWNPNCSAGYRHIIRQPKYLLGLPCNLHLFLGVSIGLELVDVRDHIERQWMHEDVVASHGLVQELLCLTQKLLHSGLSCATRCLVGRHNHFPQAELLMQGPQSHSCDRCGAVRVGKNTGAFLHPLPGYFTIDLGHHEGHFRLVPECRRVIDDDWPWSAPEPSQLFPVSSDLRCKLFRKAAGHCEENHIRLSGLADGKLLHLHHAQWSGKPLSSRPPRSEELDVLQREASALQHINNLQTDSTRRPDDSHALRLVHWIDDALSHTLAATPRCTGCLLPHHPPRPRGHQSSS